MEEKIIQEEPKRPNSSETLQEKFKTLEQDWRSFTQSSSKIRPIKKCSSRIKCNSVQHQLQLFDSSPRHLMSSLQNPTRRVQQYSPFSSPVTVTVSGEVWRMRENELAKEGLRRERKRAIERGELKGRRLFEDESEVGFDGSDEIQGFCGSICGECDERGTEHRMLCFGDLEKNEEPERESVVMEDEMKRAGHSEGESEVGFEENCEIHSVCSSISDESDERETGEEADGMLCFNGRWFSSEKSEQREREVVGAREELSEAERVGERKLGFGSGSGGRRLLLVKLCFVVVFVAFVFGIFGGLDGLESGDNVVLIPT